MDNIILWYNFLLTAMFIIAPMVFFSLLFFSAPYGRYTRPNGGHSISSRRGWIIMELPAVLVILFCFMSETTYSAAYVLLALWELHYLQRTFVFPFQFQNPLKPMPILIVAMGFIFNMINGFLNGVSLTLIHTYNITWLSDPRFIVGTLLFIIGFIINRHADRVLRHLRKPGETDYKIPQGGLYNLISCPNYFGEIIQWMGWAIATWSLAGLAFFIWTLANLLPRALKHSQWYRATFPEYPKKRRALIPWVL